MNRYTFQQSFGTSGPVVLPVIHVLDAEQTKTNIQSAIDGGCPGVFLINHDFEKEKLVPIIKDMRRAFPDVWIGVNFLAVTGKFAFPILGQLQAEGVQVDGYWADDARIDERRPEDDQPEAEEIADIRNESGWTGLYIGGTAFKKQREVEPAQFAKSARIATRYMDVVVTSGVATGHAADVGKIETFRENCGDTALGLASGITPENAAQYADAVDLFMVATGINFEGDFYNIDPDRLKRLMDITRK
ncbi:adenine phosphoribosyltransferase [Roseovarius faecimaris]|uniref:Adenine phosphoribosyltransferase n=1 Tax=Roseovarius faecimaris TaxID=2494550 RepID=A0A6I6ISH9_9RHOB|nr:BtpA/SgcQ family protein [Roseovarius faecimaris]QGX98781.1 adenine phosphoribosyltransferase [Roseovarius faecimaris]